VYVMSINIWRQAGDTLDITCNFLYCNQQVHRDFLITLYYATIISQFSVHLVETPTTKFKQLMLCRGIIAVYCQNRKKHID
jgi:hypothetical protein